MSSDQYFTEQFPCQLSQIFIDGKSVIFSFANDISNVLSLMLFPGLLFKTGSFPEQFRGEVILLGFNSFTKTSGRRILFAVKAAMKFSCLTTQTSKQTSE